MSGGGVGGDKRRHHGAGAGFAGRAADGGEPDDHGVGMLAQRVGWLVEQEFLEFVFEHFVLALEIGDVAENLFQDFAQGQAPIHAGGAAQFVERVEQAEFIDSARLGYVDTLTGRDKYPEWMDQALTSIDEYNLQRFLMNNTEWVTGKTDEFKSRRPVLKTF